MVPWVGCMKISLDWLSDFVNLRERDPLRIAETLTMRTAEVERVEVLGALLANCCVGKVTACAPHPNADRLTIATVTTDRGAKRVVCGGTNLRTGMLVAFAHIGAQVRWHGGELQAIAPVKIRGEMSEGMICAAEELDLGMYFPVSSETGERPILDLSTAGVGSGKWEVGASLREALGLDDTVFHISNTAITHRSDLFSQIGFARELVAIGFATWKKHSPADLFLHSSSRTPFHFPRTPLPFRLTAEPMLMPRYCACTIAIASLGETPVWMRTRLAALGQRSRSLPVDITNYVAAEIGVPLHSFDVADIRGDVLCRESRTGETITTLDSVTRTLPAGAIVLSDDAGIFDLVGIMGGLRSSTKETTRQIYLHAASLDPVRVRRASLALDHRTEASLVYEKGVAPVTAEQGFHRALSLFLALCPGAHITSRLDTRGDNGRPRSISLDLARVAHFLGRPVQVAEARRTLTALGCTVKEARSKKQETRMIVIPPLWRMKDLKMPEDLCEEIGRIGDYDRVPETLPSAPVRIPARDCRLAHFRESLAAEGYREIHPLSLIGEALLKACNMDTTSIAALRNPLSGDTALLQPSVLPRLLEHAQRNILNAGSILQSFTISTIFTKAEEVTECGVLHAPLAPTTIKTAPALILKERMIAALEPLGYRLATTDVSSSPPFAHSGQCTTMDFGGTHVGLLFSIHPDVCAQFDLRHGAAVLLLNLSSLFALPSAPSLVLPLPAFPAIRYDVTFPRDHRASVASLLKTLRTRHPLLESVEIVDLFEGSASARGQYNLTLRFTYRAHDRTLTETEAKAAHEKVTSVSGTGHA